MKSRAKAFIRGLFYRSAVVQLLVGLASILTKKCRFVPVLHFFSYDEDQAIGPLQRDEALALFGMVRVLRPATIVEFGFFHGHSAFNFLQAVEGGAFVFSYDIDPESSRRARREFSDFPNFTFLEKSMTEFAPSDVGNRQIDLIFFDAAHDARSNRETFVKVLPHLSPSALVVIHDTGVWASSRLTAIHKEFISKLNPPHTPEGDVVHQPEERDFVNWITSSSHGFVAIHLHSTRVLRHGLTLLQRSTPLSAHIGLPVG